MSFDAFRALYLWCSVLNWNSIYNKVQERINIINWGFSVPCSVLLWVPLSSSLGSFGYFYVDLLLLLSLSNFSLFVALLAAERYNFSLLCMHRICRVDLFWILASIHIFSRLLSCGVPCSRSKIYPYNYALYLPADVLYSLCRIPCYLCQTFWRHLSQSWSLFLLL